MKVKYIIELAKKYGKNKTLKEILKKEGWNDYHLCPKCEGEGTNKIKVNNGDWTRGIEPKYKDKECNICNGHGYTKEEYKLSLSEQMTKSQDKEEYLNRHYPIEYTGEKCPNCGRVRVEKWTHRERICEKCNWNLDKNKYN